MEKTKGLIALDIDGTITATKDELPIEVSLYLKDLSLKGWGILFVTGRAFSWSCYLLENLSFSYWLAVHNGALIASMPSKKIIYRNYLRKADLLALNNLLEEFHSSTVAYSGVEFKEQNYYCPQKYDSKRLAYLQIRKNALGEEWIALNEFSDVPLDSFCAFRIFEDDFDKAKKISYKIEEVLQLPAPLMIDSFNGTSRVIQVTAKDVTKGAAISHLSGYYQRGQVIAAGDDHNDIPMFDKADISIVMETAPEEVKVHGDIIAKSAKVNGIIDAVEQAIQRLS